VEGYGSCAVHFSSMRSRYPWSINADIVCSHWDMFHENLSMIKGNNYKIMKWRVMVFVQYTSTQLGLSTYTVLYWYLLLSPSCVPHKIRVWKITKGNNSKIREWRVIVLVLCTSPQWDLYTPELSCSNLL